MNGNVFAAFVTKFLLDQLICNLESNINDQTHISICFS